MEAIQTPQSKVCNTCNKAIEIAKYRIHEATCARNNYKCPMCSEIVPKSEKEHHETEMHSIVRNLKTYLIDLICWPSLLKIFTVDKLWVLQWFWMREDAHDWSLVILWDEAKVLQVLWTQYPWRKIWLSHSILRSKDTEMPWLPSNDQKQRHCIP
jgi:hypothetical protein